MKHAGGAALDKVEELLGEVRKQPDLNEPKRGIFYRKGVGYLHFHEGPTGVFADLKIEGRFQLFPVNTPAECWELLAKIEESELLRNRKSKNSNKSNKPQIEER